MSRIGGNLTVLLGRHQQTFSISGLRRRDLFVGVISNFPSNKDDNCGPFSNLSVERFLTDHIYFLLLDALGCLVSGGGAGHVRASLTFFPLWANE